MNAENVRIISALQRCAWMDEAKRLFALWDKAVHAAESDWQKESERINALLYVAETNAAAWKRWGRAWE